MLWWDRDDLAFDDLIGALREFNRRQNGSADDEYGHLSKALKRLAKGYGGAQHEDVDYVDEGPLTNSFVQDAAAAGLLDDNFFRSAEFLHLVEMPSLIASELKILISAIG